jgi:hypothetical protein
MSTEKKIQLINPKREPLTPEKLREFSGLNLSDEQAEEIIWYLTLQPSAGYFLEILHIQIRLFQRWLRDLHWTISHPTRSLIRKNGGV